VLDQWPPTPLDLMGDQSEFRFERFGDYVAALVRAPPATNAVLLVGHTTLRHRCMVGSLDRPANDEEIELMTREVQVAIAEGASGLSTGLDYPGAIRSSTEEVLALAEVASRCGGIYATHTRDYFDKVEEAIEEAFLIAREARIPLILSHHQATGPHNFGRCRYTLAQVERAMTEMEVSLDAYPYAATSTVIKPERCVPEIKVVISWSNPHPEMTGMELADIARLWGCTLREAAERLRPGGAIYFQLSEEDVRRVLTFPHTMIGSDGMPSDKLPHPRLWGTFPRVLGHYVRELSLLTLEDAVRRMTGLPAARLGLDNRGIIRPEAFADITVFDPGEIVDRATFLQPKQPAAGVLHVFVNGEEVWDGQEPTRARPGSVLQRSGVTAA
jgi:N-acyl-D-amino-acid deacylase